MPQPLVCDGINLWYSVIWYADQHIATDVTGALHWMGFEDSTNNFSSQVRRLPVTAIRLQSGVFQILDGVKGTYHLNAVSPS